QVRVTDVDRRVALTDVFAIAVSSPLRLNVAAILPGTSGSVFSGKASAQGGRAPYTYTVSAGQLPTGLSLNRDDGSITGTPPNATDQTLTLQVADADGRTDSAATRISVVAPAVTPSSNRLTLNGFYPNIDNNRHPYSASVQPAGGAAPYRFTITVGTLPSGVALNPDTGEIAGTPAGIPDDYSSTITVRLSDAAGEYIDTSFFVRTWRGLQIIGSPYNRIGIVGQEFSGAVVTATGGFGPYDIQFTSLPPGLRSVKLNSAAHAIVGVPTSLGNFPISCVAIDAEGNRATCSNTAIRSITVVDMATPGQVSPSKVAVVQPNGYRFGGTFEYGSYYTGRIRNNAFGMSYMNVKKYDQVRYANTSIEYEYPFPVKVDCVRVINNPIGTDNDINVYYDSESGGGKQYAGIARYDKTNGRWQLGRPVIGRKFYLAITKTLNYDVDLRMYPMSNADYTDGAYADGNAAELPYFMDLSNIGPEQTLDYNEFIDVRTGFSRNRPMGAWVPYDDDYNFEMRGTWLPQGVTFDPVRARISGKAGLRRATDPKTGSNMLSIGFLIRDRWGRIYDTPLTAYKTYYYVVPQ
ncbi:Ig domain-containing protein, partial [Methylobacterium hispanicum]